VVVAREREEAEGDRRLVGYVVPRAGAQADEAELLNELRRLLQEQLPGYMVPAALMVLESLPLTANGKLDRKGLPVPEESVQTEYTPPEGLTEELLAQMWSTLLKRERVGRHDNFFELGGHSLLGMQLIARIANHFRVELPIQDIFARSTLRELALAIEAHKATTASHVRLLDQFRRLDEVRKTLAAAGQAMEEGEI
jgi:hypothetical protein